MTEQLKAPYPYFGGKSRIAPLVWRAFGNVRSYVEPFAGSLAVLLARPTLFAGSETVNDADGLLSNFWRSMVHDPDAVIAAAEWPVNECDLHARHLWLVGQRERITERLMGDQSFCDPKAAGWWVWGISSWIGSGWCSGEGPWIAVDGVLTDSRQLPHLGNDGMGVNRQLPHLGNDGMGVNRQLPHLGNDGRGVNRKLPHLGNDGRGLTRQRYWLSTIVERLRDVRVACGDWSRVCGPSVTHANSQVAAVFLDPPYSVEDRATVYSVESRSLSHDVRQWALEHGDDPAYRIVLAGYESEHDEHMPPSWKRIEWKAIGGFTGRGGGNTQENSTRERLWLSPHCLPVVGPKDTRQVGLFTEWGNP